MTIYQIHGCGQQRGWTELVRGTEVVLNIIPKVKVELIVSDEQVEDIIETICTAARTGEVGDGKIFISPIEEVVRIRTGERGVDAV